MKMFTVREANELLPSLQPKLEHLKAYYSRIEALRKPARAAAQSAQFGGGGMESGTVYVNSLYEIGKLTTEFHDLGVQIKDYTRGLIDFPSLKDDRVILLCWRLGEELEIEWWHEIDDGFAGRQRL